MKTQSTNTSAVQCQEINKTPTISKCERIKRIYSRSIFFNTYFISMVLCNIHNFFFFFLKNLHNIHNKQKVEKVWRQI